MLTKTQNKVHRLHSAGFSADEIADMLNIEPNTVRKHIDNIKKELGWHKATELAGLGICQFLGIDYSEIRKKMIATVLSILLCVASFGDQERIRVRRTTRRKHTIEFVQTVAA